MLVEADGKTYYMHNTDTGYVLIPFEQELESPSDIYASQEPQNQNFYATYDDKGRLIAYINIDSYHRPFVVPSIPLAFYHDGKMYLVTQDNTGIVMQHGKTETICFSDHSTHKIVTSA